MPLRDPLKRHEADVVPVTGILVARISKANEKLHERSGSGERWLPTPSLVTSCRLRAWLLLQALHLLLRAWRQRLQRVPYHRLPGQPWHRLLLLREQHQQRGHRPPVFPRP